MTMKFMNLGKKVRRISKRFVVNLPMTKMMIVKMIILCHDTMARILLKQLLRIMQRVHFHKKNWLMVQLALSEKSIIGSYTTLCVGHVPFLFVSKCVVIFLSLKVISSLSLPVPLTKLLLFRLLETIYLTSISFAARLSTIFFFVS